MIALAAPSPATPQSSSYTLRSPSGDSTTFPGDSVRQMLERTRRLETILNEDPDVLYYLGTGPEVTTDAPEPAYPWNAVRVQNDSVARVAVPANYREARRAYYNYAVRRMEQVRSTSPATSCDTTVAREAELVAAFVEGWIVTRTLYGGPAFRPLDAFVFAREEGHLPAMIVALDDVAVGGCVDRWRERHPGAVAGYDRWREAFSGGAATGEDQARSGPPDPGGTTPPAVRDTTGTDGGG